MTEKTEEEKEKIYSDNLKKTIISVIFGIIGGVITNFSISDPDNPFGISILILVILAQLPTYTQIGIKLNELKAKDWFYVAFLTFISWFVTWGIFLNIGT